jgi:hypothetical protein
LLERHSTKQQINWAFWIKYLGTSIKLGAIPWESAYSRVESCQRATKCTPIIKIMQPANLNDQHNLSFWISNDQQKFMISFYPKHGLDYYTINLEVLWFWELLNSSAAQTQFLSDTNLKITRECCQRDPEALF